MISKIFFVIFLLYILYAIFLAREKYHLLIIPFILDSNFFGFFELPFGQINSDIVFVVIIMIWLLFLSKKQKIRWTKALSSFRIILLIFYSFLVLVLLISIFQYGDPSPSFMVFRRLFRYIVISFLIAIMFRFEKEELSEMADLIEYFTVGLSLLYIFHSGLGIQIFQAANYGEYDYGGTIIFRNFAALPYFIMFSLCRITLKEKKGIYEISSLFIFLATLLLSYTRSLVIMGVFVVIISLMIRAAKFSKSLVRIFKLLIILPILFIVISFTFSWIFPNQTKFFLSRIENITNAQSTLSDQTVDLRSKIIMSRIDKVLQVNPITGLGFIHEESAAMIYHDLFVRPGDRKGQVVVGDQSWGNMIALIGFLGTGIYLLMILYPFFFLLMKRIFLKQDITCIAAIINLMGILFINSFFDTILIKGVFLISFLLALIIIHTNLFIVEQFEATNYN
jgi:hypothetical protein